MLYTLIIAAFAQDPDAPVQAGVTMTEEGQEPLPAEEIDLDVAPLWSLPPDPALEPEPEPDPEEEGPGLDLLNVPGLPIQVTLDRAPFGEPNPWSWSENDATMDVRLGIVNHPNYAQISIGGTPWQWDLAVMEKTDSLVSGVIDLDDEDTHRRFGEWQEIEHETLGPLLVRNYQAWDSFMARDYYGQMVIFTVEGAGVKIAVRSTDSFEAANRAIGTVLAGLEVTEPALLTQDLPYGKLEADAGYDITLPEGWRALTETEANLFDRSRVTGEGPFTGSRARVYLIDTRSDTMAALCAAAGGGALEVLEGDKSPVSVDNFKTVARTALRGGTYRVVTGNDDSTVQSLAEVPIKIDKKQDAKVDFLTIGEREAYLWRVTGSYFERPMLASVFYTTYADVGLTCTAWTDPAQTANLEAFDAMVEGIRIREGVSHPMPLTLRGRYKRWWPTSNPLLQLYWLPFPFLLLAGWLVLREDD